MHSAKHSLSPQSKRRGPPPVIDLLTKHKACLAGLTGLTSLPSKPSAIPECKEIAAELGRVPDSAIHDILEKKRC